MVNPLLSIIENDNYTKEEKELLAKQLVKELQQREKQEESKEIYTPTDEEYEENKELYESMTEEQRNNLFRAKAAYKSKSENERQEEIKEKSREKAISTKKKINQYNVDARADELINIISHIKGKTGAPIYTKNELERQTSFELESIYDMYKTNKPELIEEALKEIAMEKELQKQQKKETVIDNEENPAKEVETNENPNPVQDEVSQEEPEKDEEHEEAGQVNDSEKEIKKMADKQIADDGEGRKKATRIGTALGNLRSIVDSNAGKAALVVGAGIAAVALLIINAPVAIGAVAVGLAGNEIRKGMKGR